MIFRKLETKVSVSVSFNGSAFWRIMSIFHSMFLKYMLFCETVAAFHEYSLKSLFSNLWTWSIKMSVVDSSFSNVEGRALSSFHHFFSLDFSTSICKWPFLVLPPLKSQKNDMKFRKIKSKIWKDIFKLFCRLNY